MQDKEGLEIQQSIVNLLIRVTALEKILYNKGYLSVEEYQQSLIDVGKEVSDKLEKEFVKTQTEVEGG